MRRTLRITVDGQVYNVVVDELENAADPVVAAHEAVAPAAPAVSPTTAHFAVAAPAPPAVPTTAGADTITAPIGGVVRAIKATVGGSVAVGDKVVVIEAMKMKTEVVAKIAGTVKSISAQVDEPVSTGQVLITLG